MGPLVTPGRYSVELLLVSAAGVETLSEPQFFAVKPAPVTGTANYSDVAAFQQRVGELSRRMGGANKEIERSRDRINHIRAALLETPKADLSYFERLDTLNRSLEELSETLNGDAIRSQKAESTLPSLRARVWRVGWMNWDTTQTPTQTQRREVEIAADGFEDFQKQLRLFIEVDLAQFESDLEAAGAPWTPGRKLSG